jgi:hypothetical protein
MAFCIACAALSFGSFAVLMIEDRRLGVPLPYSVPIAFVTMLVAAPLLLALVDVLRARVPVHVQATVPRPGSVAGASPRPSNAEGVVLLDLSRPERPRECAA